MWGPDLVSCVIHQQADKVAFADLSSELASRRMKQKQISTASETREKLLSLAARSFGVQGFSATTMRSIAEQAGIEAASIYYHFKSKEELVDEVMAHGAQAIVNQLEAHLAALPVDAGAERRFRAAIMGQMSGLIKFGDFALANSRLLGQLPDKVRERQVMRREQHQRLWNTLLEDLKTEGLLRPDLDLAMCRVVILSSINAVQTWFNPQKGTLENVANQICEIFLNGIKKGHP